MKLNARIWNMAIMTMVSLSRKLHAHEVVSICQKEPVGMTIEQWLMGFCKMSKPLERDGASHYCGTQLMQSLTGHKNLAILKGLQY